MGRVWTDENEDRTITPANGLKLIVVLIIIGALLMVLTGCGVKITRPQPADGAESVPLPTAPVQQPLVTEPAPLDMEPEPCDRVTEDASSIYTPDDWDVWCDAVNWQLDYLENLSTTDRNAVCREFWETTDSELMAMFIGGEITRDDAIGLLDGLWTVC